MDISKISRIGGRSVNEDFASFVEKNEDICLVLADGLGGHGFGEIASKIAVNAVLERFADSSDYLDFLVNAVNYAQRKLNEIQKSNFKFSNMRTTITIAFINHDTVSYLHVGDSRIYMFRNGKILHCTSDHSVPGMLVKTGEIKFNQIRGHSDRNKLLRVLGQPNDKVKYEISEPIKLFPNDALLLCSDGYWECIDEAHMLHCLKRADSAYDWMERMNAVVDRNGSRIKMDNNSAIAAIYT